MTVLMITYDHRHRRVGPAQRRIIFDEHRARICAAAIQADVGPYLWIRTGAETRARLG